MYGNLLVDPPENPYLGFACLSGFTAVFLIFAGASIHDAHLLAEIGVWGIFFGLGLFARGVLPNRFDSFSQRTVPPDDQGYVTA